MADKKTSKINTPVPSEDFYKVMEKLENFDLLFSKLVSIGKPMFCDGDFCKTACVTFDRKGRYLRWYFYKPFWDGLDVYNRAFMFCHELLHLLLDHGMRLRRLDREIGNIAADICINEMLVRNFGFVRNQIKNGEKFCWLDTVFSKTKHDPATLSNKETMEYYFNLLYECAEKVKGFGGMLVDDHSHFDDMDDEDLQDMADFIDGEIKGMPQSVKDFVKKIKEGQTKEGQKGKLKGGAAGACQKMMDKFSVKRKPKWESVIAEWKRNALKRKEIESPTWMKVSRRYNNIYTNMPDCYLPSQIDQELPPDKRRITLLAALDTSGSCASLADRFWAAVKSLDQTRFDLHLVCFDTSVYEISLKEGQLYGFGGTSFSIIEDYILQTGKKYFDGVFVLTDGFGDTVKPKYPNRWHIFLTESNSKECFPNDCHFHELSKYE